MNIRSVEHPKAALLVALIVLVQLPGILRGPLGSGYFTLSLFGALFGGWLMYKFIGFVLRIF